MGFPIQSKVRSDFITIKLGQVAGVKQMGYGLKDGNVLITLNFEASIGAREPYDALYITGTQNMEVIIKGGTQGDMATVAMLVNSIPNVI